MQTESGSTATVGINTTRPATTLGVNGAETVLATSASERQEPQPPRRAKNSQSTTLTASAFNSSTKAAVSQNFRWQAEPSANNTSSPSGTLNLLFGSGSSTLSETGLHTVSGSPVTGSGTIALIWNSAPTSLNTPNAIVKRDSNGKLRRRYYQCGERHQLNCERQPHS